MGVILWIVAAVAAAILAPASRAQGGGTITTIAGGGTRGFPFDGFPATSVTLPNVFGVAVDEQANVYIALQGVVARVDARGALTTFAGSRDLLYGGPVGDGGPATAARLVNAQGVAVDRLGNVYIADADGMDGPGGDRVRKVAPDGTITTVAGTGDRGFSGDGGPATSARLAGPSGVAVDRRGNLYIADLFNRRVRKVSADGTITTIAGTGDFRGGPMGDGGPAILAQIGLPTGVAVDAQDNVYVADANRVRKIDAGGTITTFAGTAKGFADVGFADQGFSGDGGPAASAQLNGPTGVAVDGHGSVYIADAGNNRVRRVTGGTITTIAGNGSSAITRGMVGDGGPATSAYLDAPWGVAVDGQGDVYIAEYLGSRVRKVSPALDAAKALPLPSNHTCTSRRAFPIRIRQLPGVRYSFATVTLNGRRIPVYVYTARRQRVTRIGRAYVNRRRFRAFIDLRGRARGTYRVRVSVTTTTGRVITGTRRYRTCSRRLKGTIPRL